MAASVLLCSDAFWDERGEHVVAIDPTVEIVRLVGDDQVTANDLDRITIAHQSPDLYPDRHTPFLDLCLRAPNLRWMQSMMAGTDNPVYGRLRTNGVMVTSAIGAAATSIAQTVMMYLLGLGRQMPRMMRSQARGAWDPVMVRDLDGMHLGIVGMGSIGGEVARFGVAFGMHPIGLRRSLRGDEPCETWTIDRLHELLAWSDVVVLSTPLTDETRGMFGRAEFDLMRPGAWFVNVGRGEVVDEAALVDALRSGKVGGAGLDVFATEPLPPDHPLWSLPNVIITPHSSASSKLADRRIDDLFLDNFERYSRGLPLRNVVS